jgi:hypothetical protein
LTNITDAKFRYYGISPFEIEIIYEVLKKSFGLREEQLGHVDESLASVVEIYFPVSFDESFFTWFPGESWFKIKEVLKEMAKRRGRRDIKIVFEFCGYTTTRPRIRFSLKGKKDREFEQAIEKIEYMVDTINMQTNRYSEDIVEVEYSYSEDNHRWIPYIITANHRAENDKRS